MNQFTTTPIHVPSDGTSGKLGHPVLDVDVPPIENSVAHSSIYVYDLVDQRNICLSASVTSLLGYSAEALDVPEDLSLAYLIHPDDLARVAEHFQSFSTLRSGEMITLTYRMRHADGTWRWLRSYESSLIAARDGFPLQILGIVQLLPRSGAIEENAIAASQSSVAPTTARSFVVSLSTYGMADWRVD